MHLLYPDVRLSRVIASSVLLTDVLFSVKNIYGQHQQFDAQGYQEVLATYQVLMRRFLVVQHVHTVTQIWGLVSEFAKGQGVAIDRIQLQGVCAQYASQFSHLNPVVIVQERSLSSFLYKRLRFNESMLEQNSCLVFSSEPLLMEQASSLFNNEGGTMNVGSLEDYWDRLNISRQSADPSDCGAEDLIGRSILSLLLDKHYTVMEALAVGLKADRKWKLVFENTYGYGFQSGQSEACVVRFAQFYTQSFFKKVRQAFKPLLDRYRTQPKEEIDFVCVETLQAYLDTEQPLCEVIQVDPLPVAVHSANLDAGAQLAAHPKSVEGELDQERFAGCLVCFGYYVPALVPMLSRASGELSGVVSVNSLN